MDSSVRKLNPLLRLAAISGVEAAIKLHIHRGDDLDARDGSGATPLILAAGRRRLRAVKLLLSAGANPTLADPNGKDALAHALKAGCAETIAVLSAAMARISALKPSEEPVEDTVELGAPASEIEANNPDGLPATLEVLLSSNGEMPMTPAGDSSPIPAEILISKNTDDAPVCERDVLALDDEPLNEIFADGWETEEEVSAPKGDETVAEAARLVHEVIAHHKVVDRDEGWGDVDLHLPVRAAPLTRDEGDGAVRALLLAALREGVVSEDELIDVCSNADGSRNEEAERLIAFVAGELGATVVEWTDSDAPFPAETSMEEDYLLTEAAEFAEELASGHNDPFRFYAKDIRGDLLDADEEIALGREMEEAGRAAISALSAWPDGLSDVFAAAARVSTGDADVESFSAGPEPSSDEEPSSHLLGTEDEEENEPELDEDASFFVNAVAAVEAARGDAPSMKKALEEVRLTRGFLMKLAGKTGEGQARRDFVEALGRQEKARERMILSNLRLALSIAKKHRWSGVPLDDLVQEANIGLMKAVERYDWRRGFRFSTYATWWIRQQVSRSIADTGRVVRAPVHIQETARKVLREREAAEARLCRPETESETARRISVPLAKTRMLLAMFEDVASLDKVDPDSGLPRVDGLLDDNISDPADIAESTSLHRTLLGMLTDLDERSRKVIILRFGLINDDAMTLEEVGQHFGVTRERIRQIESKTMRKLSHRNKREILWPFLGDRYAPANTPSLDRTKTEAASDTDEQVSSDKLARDLSATPAEHVAQDAESPISVHEEEQELIDYPDPTKPASLFTSPTSRIADEARALGLNVEDRRLQGGDLRIVISYASPPES